MHVPILFGSILAHDELTHKGPRDGEPGGCGASERERRKTAEGERCAAANAASAIKMTARLNQAVRDGSLAKCASNSSSSAKPVK